MDGVEGGEPPEDIEMTEDGEPTEADEREFWETQGDIVEALYDHGAPGSQ